MTSKFSRLYVALASALAALPVVAQPQAVGRFDTNELPRVTRSVDSRVVSVVGNSHMPWVDQQVPLGNVPDATPMQHMQLILRRSALRQSALDGLVAAQHDPHSASFQHWLTPQEFGTDFGVADSDIAAVKAWLVAQGFTVNGVYPNRMQIDFSGSAGLVKAAFHTQEKRYAIGDASHIANAGDISVPTALRDVVAGVAGLSDLHPKPLHRAARVGQFNPATMKFTAAAPVNDPSRIQNEHGAIRGLVPYDMETIYGITAMRAKGITGKGITIAVVEDQSMVPADWTNFTKQFQLAHYGGTFAQIHPQTTGFETCVDPALNDPGQDDEETLMDAEWSTAMAPGANVEVASCDDSGSNDFGGVYTAAINLINASVRPDIISASYGLGEQFTEPAGKTQIDQMWQQADAEGISVFVSSGDSGSNPSYNGQVIGEYGSGGVDANSLGTSPNDTAVGGSDTADIVDGTTSTYFSPTMNSVYGTALSYVPEIPWNMSCGNPVGAAYEGYSSALAYCEAYIKFDPYGFYTTSEGGSGGPSSVDAKPAWQQQVRGAPKDTSRDLPDVSLFAAAFGDYTLLVTCTAAYPCTPGFTGLVNLQGGTSLSSPMFAGIQALIDQGMARKGLKADQGNAAPTLYALAEQEYGKASGTPPASLAQCNSNNGANGTSACVFHNITSGGIATQCVQTTANIVINDCYLYGTIPNFQHNGSPVKVGLMSTSTTAYTNAKSAYPAHPGWSFASGLGSVNATNLLAAWEAFVEGP